MKIPQRWYVSESEDHSPDFSHLSSTTRAKITGIPDGQFSRTVVVYQPSPQATQSGLGQSREWRIEFLDTATRWDNPLMGWASSRDPVGKLRLSFQTQQEAVNYAKDYGFHTIIEGQDEANAETPNHQYSENFAYHPPKKSISDDIFDD
eukprot:CAMPEP_0201546208 /NCGR_PEP_ID=MMETSP0173_2-20130828/2569_1 /ASSEMBLY_ACC=CAM_ASM_000268 /TAXON_ID=218659 /ORGANISM="Vexillifera sp., Strain DIVA3 564/2" /LENGTH=148 /DNA_ID=CAMNT_0047954815 /DNA_START=81 /DNA_END=527 /DNA_ORIENTATION=-